MARPSKRHKPGSRPEVLPQPGATLIDLSSEQEANSGVLSGLRGGLLLPRPLGRANFFCMLDPPKHGHHGHRRPPCSERGD